MFFAISVWDMSPDQFVSSLRKLQPRFYSIASSLAAYPEEVHITVGAVRYEAHGRLRKGVCSTFCAERLHIGDKLPVFIHHNPNFKLPKDANTPIIMIDQVQGLRRSAAFCKSARQ